MTSLFQPNRRRFLRSALSTAALGLALPACPGIALAEMAAPIKGPDQFGIDMLAKLTQPGGNTLCSPLSLDTAIRITRAGIVPASPTDTTKPAARPTSCQTRSGPLDAQVALWREQGLTLSNAVWLDRGIDVTEHALETLGTDWRLVPETLDLQSDGKTRINNWVSQSTDGLIPELIPDMPEAVAYLVTSALVFRDAWATPFNADLTVPAAFQLNSDAETQHPFMHSTDSFPVWQVEKDVLTVLPFAEGLQMMLHLPGTDLTAETASPLQPGASLYAGDARPRPIALPLLDLSSPGDLGPALDNLGVKGCLQEGLATLTTVPQQLGPVFQGVALKVDEAGAEAAAATAIAATRSLDLQPEDPLRFDRPFNLYIYDPATGVTIIAAHIADPRG